MSEEPRAWEYREHSLIVLPGLSWDEWTTLWSTVDQTNRSAQFWAGDALLAGRDAFGERFAQVVDPKYINQQRGAMWVCSRIEPSRRKANLSYSLHRELASLEPAEQDRWLALAAADTWTVKDLKEAMARRGNGGPPLSDAPDSDRSTWNDDPTFGTPEEIDGRPVLVALNGAETPVPPVVAWTDDPAALRALIDTVRRLGNDIALGRADAGEVTAAEWQIMGALKTEGLNTLTSYESAIRAIPDAWRGKITIEFNEQVFGGRRHTVTLMREGKQIAVGIAPTLPCAITEAALSAILSR